MDDLDRWTRVLPLGTGAFGQVHLAWDTADRRWVAVKRFTGQDELGLLRFVIESRIRVEHAHLVRTLAFRLVDDRAWLVTQLARGGSLRQLMDRAGRLPWGWAVEAVDQVLDALVALHATGVVHRDLKPANLLLRDAGQVRPHLLVGDFGIATWRTVSMTGIGAAIGTPGYLAPEYLDGQQPSPTTDLFAVGVLAAELLAGRRLIHFSNSSQDIPADWTHTLPLPDDLPAPIGAVFGRMADPDPRRRYVDCAQAREALLAAAPPGARGDLTSVDVPDLLTALPPGWTVDGPDLTGPEPDPATTTIAPDPATVAVPQVITPPPAPSPGSAPDPAASRRSTKERRRGRRAVLLLVLVVLLGGAATLWWAAANHRVPGSASPGGATTDDTETSTPRWTPVQVERCTKAELARERDADDGTTQRCQRSPGADAGQHWVLEPPGGFPKSDPAGPFPAETCTTESDTAYTPVGEQVICTDGAWRVTT